MHFSLHNRLLFLRQTNYHKHQTSTTCNIRIVSTPSIFDYDLCLRLVRYVRSKTTRLTATIQVIKYQFEWMNECNVHFALWVKWFPRGAIYPITCNILPQKEHVRLVFGTSQGKLDPVARKMCFCTHKLLSLAIFVMQLKKLQITLSRALAKSPRSPTLRKKVLNFRTQHNYSASCYTSF